MAQQNVSRYFKFGYYKFSDIFGLMQISEICKNPSCDVKNCNLRHPQICKYFCDYKKCKFGEWCYFSHQEIDKLSKRSWMTLKKI